MTHHCRNRELTVRMATRYALEAEHVAFVTGSGKTTNKVQGIVEEARERTEAEAVEHSGGAFAALEGASEGGDTVGDGADDDTDGTLAAFGAVESERDGVDEDQDDTDGRADAPEEDDGQAGLSDFM